MYVYIDGPNRKGTQAAFEGPQYILIGATAV